MPTLVVSLAKSYQVAIHGFTAIRQREYMVHIKVRSDLAPNPVHIVFALMTIAFKNSLANPHPICKIFSVGVAIAHVH